MGKLDSHTILVVDDHAAARYALSRSFRAAGFRTLEAAAGAQALELAEYANAVVLDVHLPDLLGIEVCRLLRLKPSTARLPVVHVSAVYLDDEHKEAAAKAGGDAYLTGPVDADVVIDTVRRLLAERGTPAS